MFIGSITNYDVHAGDHHRAGNAKADAA